MDPLMTLPNMWENTGRELSGDGALTDPVNVSTEDTVYGKTK